MELYADNPGEPLLLRLVLLLLMTLCCYALQVLLERHRALPASLGLGMVWALWHLPLFWTAGAPLAGRSGALTPCLGVVSRSVV